MAMLQGLLPAGTIDGDTEPIESSQCCSTYQAAGNKSRVTAAGFASHLATLTQSDTTPG